jgi:peroxiredoxin
MKKLLLLVAIFSCLKSNAQYRIEISMQAPKDSVYYLYHWYQSEKLYLIKDTAKVETANKIVFSGNKDLSEGMYFLVAHKTRLFDFPLVGQTFKITTDSSDFVGKMTIEGNIEASTYANFTKENIRLQRAFQKASNETDKKTIHKQYQSLTKTYISSNPNTFTANFLKANIPVETEAIKPNATRQDTLAYVKNYYTHALDNINLSDDRLIRTTLLDNIFDDYLKNIAFSNSPDEIIALADNLLARTKPNSEIRKYIVIKFGNKFIAPEVLGCDKVYTEIAKKYIIGEPKSYDASTIQRNIEYVNRIEPSLMGKILPDMCLTDTLGNWATLWDLKAKYTMVVIYDYACGHCQEYTKKLVDYYPKLEQQGMKVYMCCKVSDRENWLKFIKTYKTEAFTNVMDSHKIVDFDNTYNASLVPKVFLLDEQKKVLSNLRLELPDFERMMKNR